MHLFIVHQFPDYDNFVPIIVNLKKETNSNFAIMNIFPVHDLKYYGFNSILKKYKIQFIDVFNLNKKSIFIKLLLNFIIILPKMIIKRLNRLWYYFYHNYTLFYKKHLVSLIKREKIKSINIDNSLPERYKKIFFSACKETNIKFNCYRIGVEMRQDIKIKAEEYSLFDHTIIQDQNFMIDTNKINDNKFIRISSPRYSLNWIKEVENSYKYKLREYDSNITKRKLRVLLVTRNEVSNKSWQIIHYKLKKIENLELRIKIKPRGQFSPLHIQENIINEYNTSELVNWADVIVSHSTSILIEAIIKNKKILFLNYLYALEKKKEFKYIFEDQNIVEYVNSIENLLKRIQYFKSNKINIDNNEKYQQSKKFFLQKYLGNDYFNKTITLKKEFINIYLT